VSVHVLDPAALARDLTVPDLTAVPGHALARLVDEVVGALAAAWGAEVRLVRSHPVVSTDDNYDRLGFPPDAVTRDARYSRYVSETCLLRTHTSAMVPPALRALAAGAGAGGEVGDVLLACPGLVYRRDAIDRLHTGTPHQLDLWRVTDRRRLTTDDLVAMVGTVVTVLLPGRRWRVEDRVHPYTEHGLQIDVEAAPGGEWVEVGECGMAGPSVLGGAGLPVPPVTGLAMGLGLDRILMLRMGIPDIRLLRSTDPRVTAQLGDLSPYRPVSNHPPIRRDVSIAVDADVDAELLGDRVRSALGDDAECVEAVEVRSETPGDRLPPAAVERLGLLPGQRNVLLRVVLRHVDRTLTDAEANGLRDRIYDAVHQGTAPLFSRA
jgi:phenylalanyl-tRNA synthetase alpha chain